MGCCFFFDKAEILQSSKKERTVSILRTKVEYIILGYAIRKNFWIQRYINKIVLNMMENFSYIAELDIIWGHQDEYQVY